MVVSVILLLTLSGCLAKHYDFHLLDEEGNNIVMYEDSIGHITLRGTLTSFDNFIGFKDYRENEDVSLCYETQGFDSIRVLDSKIRLWRLEDDSLIAIEKGKIMYDWDLIYSTKQVAIMDTLSAFEAANIYPQITTYFIIVESDTEVTDGLESVVVESNFSLLIHNEPVIITRKDTLWRSKTTQYQLRIH